jgi:para-nitrobenzyl esterase
MQGASIAVTATLLWAYGAAALAGTSGPIVTTNYGQVQGSTANGVSTFNGIPFAAPPVGSLRWVAPQLPAPWTGVRQATAFGSQCPQPLSQFGHQGSDEDCLYLNVQVPAAATPASKLPVMVWIHGGAFITGEGWDYDATSLVQNGNVVVVTINYRLGLLGFMAHPVLAAENQQGQTGNYGLLDQQAAIAWVKQNAVAFGGNPASVTIFGESAGGQSVIDNLASATAPSIHTAIIESGAYAPALPTVAAAEQIGQTRMGEIGCPSPTTSACLRGLTVAQILSVVNALTDTGVISPVVDGLVLPQQPLHAFNSGQFQHVPVIDGSNHDEYRLFVILAEILGGLPYTPATLASTVLGEFGTSFGDQVLAHYPVSQYPNADYDFAALITDSGFSCGAHLVNSLLAQYVPVYAYELNDPNAPDLFLPFDPNVPNAGDAHASELPYLWPLLQSSLFGKGVAQFTPAQQNLALGMRQSWTSFARYSRPLNPHGGAWLRYSTASGDLYSLTSATGANTGTGFVANHQCAFWKPLLLEESGLPSTIPY